MFCSARPAIANLGFWELSCWNDSAIIVARMDAAAMVWGSFYVDATYPIFTEVMVNEPATALSLKNETGSLFPFKPSVYSKGR